MFLVFDFSISLIWASSNVLFLLTLNNWIEDLAVMQIIIVCSKLSKGGIILLQTDGGHNNQEVRLISTYTYELKKKRIEIIWLGLLYCGKTSDEVAIGMKTTLWLFFGDKRTFSDGLCVDSSQGTPEGFGKAYKCLEMVLSHTEDISCGIHDTQSYFRLLIQKCI